MKCKWFITCPLRKLEKKGLISSKWKKMYCEGKFHLCQRYIETEQGINHPDNMLPDGTII
jgi:hypothetical protein